MLTVTLKIDAPAGHAIGVKEAIAQDLEKYGDVRVVAVDVQGPEQMRMEDVYGKKLKVTAIHERGCGFIGRIENEEVYDGVKAGALDWKSHIKPRLEYIQIPVGLFYRLLELERRIAGNDG